MATNIEPLLKPFETSAPPRSYDVMDETLRAFMRVHCPIESDSELRKRERVMGELKRMFQAWVQSVCKARGLSEELAAEAGGKLYTSGSYRLRVHEHDFEGAAFRVQGRVDAAATTWIFCRRSTP